jgi:hypothetical protein
MARREATYTTTPGGDTCLYMPMPSALRRLTAAALCAASLAVAASAGSPAPAQGALKAIWGNNSLALGAPAFPIYKKLRVDVLQQSVSWRGVATARPANPTDPNDPAYAWPAAIDEAIAQGKRYGFRVSLMLIQTPDWANGGRGALWTPDNPQDFADFAMAAARRYPAVKHWMIWGEPNKNLQPMPENSPVGPRVYARLLDPAYVALKSVRKSNVVIGGMSWTAGLVMPADFVRWMRLPNGKPPRLSWYGHNPFGPRFPKLKKRPYVRGLRDMSDVDTLHREVLRAYRPLHRRPRLWLSEYTIPSGRPDWTFDFYASARGQGKYLKAAFKIARRHSWIAGIGWYKLEDDFEGPNSFRGGLMRATGERKPSFRAYKLARG